MTLGFAAKDLVGAVVGERYRLVRMLGEGGMGAVFEAVESSGQRFALKIIHPNIALSNTGALARFVQEARAAASVRSPHVVPVHYGAVDPTLKMPFLVMPLLHGTDVEALVQQTGPLAPSVAVRVVLQAARGLGAAHATGVVHRDIKPANLFLDQQPDGSILVKVCDFGIAKTGDGNAALTATGDVMGSPAYMAPEQIKSAKHVDARCDVWSLAQTLYFALVGRGAFDHIDGVPQLFATILTEDVPALQNVAPWVPAELAAIVHGGLIRELDARCPSVAAFAEALRGFSGGAESLTPDQLRAVTPEERGRAAPKARMPARWKEITDSRAAHDETVDAANPNGARADALLGKTLGGRFQLVRLLGQGGMGAVYEARSAAGSCAVKVVLSDVDGVTPEARKRFVREARASSGISSPHVVRVLDADSDGATGVPFIVMELLSGQDLHQLVGRTGPLDPLAVARILSQACRGLVAAHATGIVHRDIKPANLFLHDLPHGEVVVKVCDFGIAKNAAGEAFEHTSAQLTKTGGMLGSPMYMSPEQAKNAKRVDVRSDVWSLCMSAYEALTGKVPWAEATTLGELLAAIYTEEVPGLATAAPWVEPRLAAIVERGLRRRPDDRWSSTAELAAALAALVPDDRLSRAMLAAVPADVRARVVAAPRALPEGSMAGAARTTPEATGVQPARRAPVAAIAIGGAVAIAAAVVVSIAAFRTKAPPPAPAAEVATVTTTAAPPAEPPPPAPAPEPLEVPVTVRPPFAKVLVNGAPAELAAGKLVLKGQPGDVFAIVATAARGKLETDVVITREGTAQPATLDVPLTAVRRAPSVAKPPGGAVPEQEKW